MNLMQKFFFHSNFLLLTTIAAYIIGILLIFCPHKLLKQSSMISPKKIKYARIFGIAVIIVIDIIIVAWSLLNIA